MEKRSRLLLCSLHQDIKRWAEMLGRKLTELSDLGLRLLERKNLHRKDMQRIDSIRLEIKSELEKYQRELYKQTALTYEKIVDKYRIFTRKFTDLMRQADIIMSLDPIKSFLVDNIFDRNIRFVNKVKKALGSTTNLESYKSLSPKKNYMTDTFNMKVHREVTQKQINSLEYQQKWLRNAQKHWFNDYLRLSNMSTPKNSKFRCGSASPTYKRRHYDTHNDDDIYQMGRDLESVKATMNRMARDIDTHQHEETQAKIALLKANYGRLNNKMQQLKEQNEELLEGIYQLSKDLRQEHKKYSRRRKQHSK